MLFNRFYHGDIGTTEAKRRLSEEKLGAYLIRLSSDRGCLTLSVRRKKGACSHIRINRTPEGYYSTEIEGKLFKGRGVKELIKKSATELDLTTKCTRDSAWAKLWTKTPEEDEYIIPRKPGQKSEKKKGN